MRLVTLIRRKNRYTGSFTSLKKSKTATEIFWPNQFSKGTTAFLLAHPSSRNFRCSQRQSKNVQADWWLPSAEDNECLMSHKHEHI
mmetsp:Transcript_43070/g.77429  ORF Transcript_43070/g.77429 Transcript_43070/m.77429 type:complete len:86 (-) Transcript_43070:143-400(-)